MFGAAPPPPRTEQPVVPNSTASVSSDMRIQRDKDGGFFLDEECDPPTGMPR